MACFCGRKEMLQFGFSSPGWLLSFLKNSTLHTGEQGGVYITGRVGRMQKQPNFCLESSYEMRNKGWPHLERMAAPTEAVASSSSPSSLPPCQCGERLAWLPPARCSSDIVILLQSCMPSEFICHIL